MRRTSGAVKGRWSPLAVAMVACLVPLATACTRQAGTDSDLTLVAAGAADNNSASVVIWTTQPGKPYSYGSMFFCLTEPGTVQVESVALSGTQGGIRLRRFATAAAKAGNLQRPIWVNGPLERLGFTATTPATMSTPCYPGNPEDNYDQSRYLTELAVEVERPSDRTASADAVIVHYRFGDRTGEATSRSGIVLCGPRDKVTPGCEPAR